MVISASNSYPKSDHDVIKIGAPNKINSKKFTQNGQIHIYRVCEYFHLFFLSACPGFIIGQASNSHFYSEFF